MTPTFTLIIPAYNLEDSLPGMLDSLLAQSYRHFDTIVVEDCAKDGTGPCADSYEEKFKEAGLLYRVIHKPVNEGLSAARNSGLMEATGDYCLFLDGDDSVEPDLLARLAEAVLKNETENANSSRFPDLLIYGFTEDYYKNDAITYSLSRKPAPAFYAGDLLSEGYKALIELEQQTLFGYAWNKAYRLDFLRQHDFSFTTIPHIEDVLFNLKVAEKMESFVCIDAALYHYANRGQTRLTSKYLPEYFSLQKRRVTTFLQMEESKMAELSFDASNRLYPVMAAVYFRSFQSAMVRAIEHGDKKAEILSWAREELSNPLYLKLKDYLSTGSRKIRLLYLPLAMGNVKTAYRRAKEICLARRYMGPLYNRLKQNR